MSLGMLVEMVLARYGAEARHRLQLGIRLGLELGTGLDIGLVMSLKLGCKQIDHCTPLPHWVKAFFQFFSDDIVRKEGVPFLFRASGPSPKARSCPASPILSAGHGVNHWARHNARNKVGHVTISYCLILKKTV